MLKKITALVLCAALSVSASAAVSAQDVCTATITQELGAAKAVEWNGKTALKANTSYTVSKNITVSKKVTIPAGTTVVVKKGAKLWVSTKGTLNVKGTLKAEAGSNIAVSGKLYEYKSKTISISGTMSFGSKSDVTINGKLAINAKGVVKGTPKSLSVGPNAVITVKGKNSCAKLAKAVEQADIEKMMAAFGKTALVDGDIYGALEKAYPASYIKYIDALFAAEGTSLKEYCDEFAQLYFAELANSGVKQKNITGVSCAVKKLTDSTSDLSAAEKEQLELTYGKISKIYTAEADLTLSAKTGNQTESLTVKVAQVGGKWYMLG